MQYKIPVQIENADPIFLGLSLKQLVVLLIGGSIAYMVFNGLSTTLGNEIAAIPGILIIIVTLVVVLFKHSEMTFIPFILNLIRYNTTNDEKKWIMGIDSYEPIEIGYVTVGLEKKKKTVKVSSKNEKINSLKDKLNKI